MQGHRSEFVFQFKRFLFFLMMHLLKLSFELSQNYTGYLVNIIASPEGINCKDIIISNIFRCSVLTTKCVLFTYFNSTM